MNIGTRHLGIAGRVACLLAALAALVRPPAGAQTALRVDGTIESTRGGLRFPAGSVQITGFGSAPAPIADTGQQECFDASGDPIPCAGTGQDGDHQAGVAWPSGRLSDNGDGTVTDQLTGLVWLQLTDCFGLETWEQALATAATLSSGNCGLLDGSQPGDWRQPNLCELLSLVDWGRTQPILPENHPFLGLTSTASYWSSSFVAPFAVAPAVVRAWALNFRDGTLDDTLKTGAEFVWPVRDPS